MVAFGYGEECVRGKPTLRLKLLLTGYFYNYGGFYGNITFGSFYANNSRSIFDAGPVANNFKRCLSAVDDKIANVC